MTLRVLPPSSISIIAWPMGDHIIIHPFIRHFHHNYYLILQRQRCQTLITFYFDRFVVCTFKLNFRLFLKIDTNAHMWSECSIGWRPLDCWIIRQLVTIKRPFGECVLRVSHVNRKLYAFLRFHRRTSVSHSHFDDEYHTLCHGSRVDVRKNNWNDCCSMEQKQKQKKWQNHLWMTEWHRANRIPKHMTPMTLSRVKQINFFV